MPPQSNAPLLQRLNSRGMMIGRPDDASVTKRELSHHDNDQQWMAPPLAPKVMEPLRHSKGLDVAPLLQRIECIEIADVVKHDNGKDYYVINVYMQQEQSRIPTNQTTHHTHLHSHHGSSSTHDRKPDYTVERRFSEFDKLRHDIREAAQHIHRHYCNFCDGFLFMMLFSPSQPTKLTKTVLRSTSSRAKMLDKFLHRLVGEFQLLRPRCRFSCYATDTVPVIMQEFLMGKSQPQETDPTLSPSQTTSL